MFFCVLYVCPLVSNNYLKERYADDKTTMTYLFYLLFLFFLNIYLIWLCQALVIGMWDLGPRTGIKPGPPCMGSSES